MNKPSLIALAALVCLAITPLAPALLVRGAWAEGAAMLLPADPAPLVARTGAGDVKFSVEIADDPSERSAGLMYRQSMPDDRGMLFIFERTQPVGFWMKNTPMPLDLVFIGQDGVVRAVMPGEPFSEAVIAPDEKVRFVLELKAGTAARKGIVRGVSVAHPAIDEISRSL